MKHGVTYLANDFTTRALITYYTLWTLISLPELKSCYVQSYQIELVRLWKTAMKPAW